MYVNCANNNRGSTVYDLFLGAVQQYGLPSRLRCDQGGENCLVALHMLHHRGERRRSVIVGSSVHNQRVERFWRDMHRCVTQLFYRLFYYMEHHAILDPTSNLHLFALHYVYKPRINEGLKHFQSAWNNHPMRTEHGHSPVQLFTAGALRLQRSGMAAVDFFDDISDDYGADEQGLATEDSEGVTVPAIDVNISEENLRLLQQQINPLHDDGNYGINIYEETLAFISRI